MENYNFRVDLKGIIRLLSDNLYSSDKVFLRELLQNAVDAVDAGKDLIPQWAFFTRCIVDFDDLTPTASREGFTRDSKLMKAKSQLEKCIFDYFVSLSQYDVRKLKQLTQIHNVAIENEQIFKLTGYI